ncbi:glycosyltransferase family 87 protein [Spirosoma sp.]|uniref:glycosyltransferase family 87 protein n=1 Tax=Spirosoma sp. TaxID=1899569 RepID=UPI0026204E17|nr:glycosyltransferase family 87 protein [Spirosoma sp.]MCX6212957.1 glycosyltransferase family 87 protein [Spirosoma sp.]
MTAAGPLSNQSPKYSTASIVLAVIILAYCVFCAVQGGDFDVFLDAGHKLATQQNIYRPPFAKGLQYYYSPFFALLLLPFSYLPFVIPELAWLLLSTFLLYRIWVLTTRYLDMTVLTKKEHRIWIFAVFFLSLRFLLYNYSMIQMTIFLMWATLESLSLFEKNRPVVGGILFGFACTTKLLPLIFLPYLIYRRHFTGFAYTLLFFGFFLIAPALAFGFDFNTFLLKEWWLVINPGNAENAIEADLGTHSLVSLIPVYLTETHNKIDIQRNVLTLTPEQAVFVTNIARLIFVAATLYFLRSLPFKRNTDKIQTIWECSYLFLVTPLLFPHQQKYAFLYIAPSVIYLVYYLLISFKRKSRNRHILLIIFAINALIFTPFISSDLLGRYAYDVLQHFRILTVSTIGLCVILAFCTAAKLRQKLDLGISQPKPLQA